MIEFLRARFDFWTIATVFLFTIIVVLCVSEWFSVDSDVTCEDVIENDITNYSPK